MALISYLNIALLLWLSASTSCGSENTGENPPLSEDVIVGAASMDAYLDLLEGKNIGLVVNHTSLIDDIHLVDTLLSRGINIKKIFAPEHGFRGRASAGAHVESGKDEQTGLPIISLYGSSRKPSDTDLQALDLIVFDIQDVGVRFYTYISTMSYVMEACAENDIPFIVLDRPNPNGHLVDGPVMEECCNSFIGLHPGVPVAHGMTVGEYARMVNGEGWLGEHTVDLTVIPVNNWRHDTPYQLPVKPSPNLPNMKSIYLYPTLCFLEATVMSVGRGTDKQFQLIGHPDFPGEYSFTPESMPGAQSPKLQGRECHGIDYSVLSEDSLRNLDRIRIDWLILFYQQYPNDDFFLSHFYKLAGNNQLRQQIEAGLSEQEIRITWNEGIEAFKETRKKYLIYP